MNDWISFGMVNEEARKAAMIRRWTREARERRPVFDCVNFPDDPYHQRGAGRG